MPLDDVIALVFGGETEPLNEWAVQKEGQPIHLFAKFSYESLSAVKSCVNNSLLGGTRVICALLSSNFCVSNISNMAPATSLSDEIIFFSASPMMRGRRAVALANSMAAWRSAVLVMMLTWLAPSCLIAEVTCRRRLTTLASICWIMPVSRKCTLRI